METLAAMILCHLVGDYLLQSHWMATEKTKSNAAAAAHALAYSVPFLFLSPSALTWAAIVIPHFLIDRFRLARFVVYAKNFIQPRSRWEKWEDCSGTGYHKDVPAWLSVWLLIAADNTIHLLTNLAAFAYFNQTFLTN